MNAKEQAQARWDHVAKPLNSLGKLEKLIVMIAGVQNTPDVRINKDCIISAGSVVTSDIPANSVASGIPAKPTGRFDMFVALRKMSKGQCITVKNQEMEASVAEEAWNKFSSGF